MFLYHSHHSYMQNVTNNFLSISHRLLTQHISIAYHQRLVRRLSELSTEPRTLGLPIHMWTAVNL